MPVLVAKIADDSDFSTLKNMVDQHDDWTLEYDKNQIKVWTKSVSDISFNMVKVCIIKYFEFFFLLQRFFAEELMGSTDIPMLNYFRYGQFF